MYSLISCLLLLVFQIDSLHSSSVDKPLIDACVNYLKSKGFNNPYTHTIKVLNSNIIVTDLKKDNYYRRNHYRQYKVVYPSLKGKRFSRIAFYKEGYLDGTTILYVDTKTKSILLVE